MSDKASFVVATPGRSVCDDNARALEKHGLLRFLAQATRRGAAGVSKEKTRLNIAIGAVNYAVASNFAMYPAESFRFRLHPWFDHWVKRQLQTGDNIISSYGYVNACFRWARAHGGKTFLDGGNSHPENFWNILSEEHRRWNCAYPPVARHHYERSMAMMADVDFVLSPSSYVSKSFLDRGFKPEQILRNVYPVNLSCFTPPTTPRPRERPLTIIAPGSLSLRKGTPYLLAAFRLIVKKLPDARLVLNRAVFDNMKEIVQQYADLAIDWEPTLPHQQLAERMRSCDLLILPSLEDGFARTVTEGLACGLPVITTPNTGASEWVKNGVNGEVVPIRDPDAITDAVLKWWEKIRAPDWQPKAQVDTALLTFEHFEREFIGQLTERGLA